jgi:hypothetical protein
MYDILLLSCVSLRTLWAQWAQDPGPWSDGRTERTEMERRPDGRTDRTDGRTDRQTGGRAGGRVSALVLLGKLTFCTSIFFPNWFRRIMKPEISNCRHPGEFPHWFRAGIILETYLFTINTCKLAAANILAGSFSALVDSGFCATTSLQVHWTVCFKLSTLVNGMVWEFDCKLGQMASWECLFQTDSARIATNKNTWHSHKEQH